MKPRTIAITAITSGPFGVGSNRARVPFASRDVTQFMRNVREEHKSFVRTLFVSVDNKTPAIHQFAQEAETKIQAQSESISDVNCETLHT